MNSRDEVVEIIRIIDDASDQDRESIKTVGAVATAETVGKGKEKIDEDIVVRDPIVAEIDLHHVIDTTESVIISGIEPLDEEEEELIEMRFKITVVGMRIRNVVLSESLPAKKDWQNSERCKMMQRHTRTPNWRE